MYCCVVKPATSLASMLPCGSFATSTVDPIFAYYPLKKMKLNINEKNSKKIPKHQNIHIFHSTNYFGMDFLPF